MNAYLVDAAARTITPFEYNSGAVSKYLPGGLCLGGVFENGDMLLVDDEALLRPATVAFRIKRRIDGQPIMSNAILTGPDTANDTKAPRMTVDELGAEIEWLDLPEAFAWFEARAAEPAMTSQSGDDPPEVLARWGDFLRLIRPDD